MRKCILLFAMILFIAVISRIAIFADEQTGNSAPKVWTQTSVADFTKGTRDSVVITNLSGGEVQIPHPMVKIVDDYIDESIVRFAAYDNLGNYSITWTEDGKLFAKKLSATGDVLIDRFQVNTTGLEDIAYSAIHGTCLRDNNQGFLIAWMGEIGSSRNDIFNIYAQFYDSIGAPIGIKQQVNDESSVGIMARRPAVFIDTNGNYWVLWEQRGTIYCQKYSKTGEKIDSNFPLNPEWLFMYESFPIGAVDSNGDIVVVWSAIVDEEAISNYYDAYIRFFNDKGEPKGLPVRIDDDTGIAMQQISDMAFDSKGNLLVVWIDKRGITHGNLRNIYGQLYNTRGTALGCNFRISNPNPYYNGGLWRADIVLMPDDQFRISWVGMCQSAINELNVNRWKIVPISSGRFISSIFDAGSGETDFQKICWEADIDSGVTSIGFKIRSAPTHKDIEQATWYGPSDTSGFYMISSDQEINPVHDSDNCIQYKAFFSTTIAGNTPILKSVSIRFTTMDTISPAPPANFAAAAGCHKIVLAWSPNTEKDLCKYCLYRGTSTENYDSTRTIFIPAANISYLDTTVSTAVTYYYALSAVDSSHNASSLSVQVSATPTGQTWYVDARNSGVGDGSYENPFPQIQQGIDASTAGDTIRVAEGLYEENLRLNEAIAVIGAGAKLCEVRSKEAQPVVICANNNLIKGFTFHLTRSSTANAVVDAPKSSVIITENIIIHSNSGAAIRCGADRLTISKSIISKNIIMDAECGITYNGSYAADSSSITISNNLIYRVKNGINVERGSSIRIINNTIHYEKGSYTQGIFGHDNKVFEVISNIIVNRRSAWHGIYHWGGMFNTVYNVGYNDVWVTGDAFKGFEPGEGNIGADPLFRNIDRGDFRLADDSPCRNAGHPDSCYNDPDGSRNDMGAYGGSDPLIIGVEHPRVWLSIQPVSGYPGDTLRVPVKIDNGAGLFKAKFDITWNPQLLTLLQVTTGELTQDFTTDFDALSENTARITLQGTAEVTGGTGSIATVIYRVRSDAPAGEACPLDIRNAELWDGLGAAIKLKGITDGVFMVKEKIESDNYIFVDQNYSGEELGTWDKPFNTIPEAIEAASAGDTIQVAAGVYTEKIRMKDGVILRGSGPLVTKITVKTEDVGGFNETAVLFEDISYGEISGFDICLTGENSAMPAAIRCVRSNALIRNNHFVLSATDTPLGIICEDSSTAIIAGNVIVTESLPMLPSAIGCISSKAEIRGNYINVLGHGTGIYLGSSNCRILGNRIILQSTAAEGIYTRKSQAFIANNSIGGAIHYMSITVKSSDSLIILNNVIYQNMTGIGLSGDGMAVIKNNIIYDHSGDRGKGIQGKGSWVVDASYNGFWNNTTDCEGVSPGVGNLYENPLFVNPEAEDYHLQSASPCIDAGDPDPQYNDPDGSRNDMGLYGGPYAVLEEGPFRPPVSMALSDTSVAAGDTVEVALRLDKAAGVAEASMLISFPADTLKLLNIRTTDYSRRFSLSTEDMGSGQTRISLSGSDGIEAESYPLVRLTLAVQRFVPQGAKARIRIGEAVLRDELAMPLAIGRISEGTVEVKTGIVAEYPSAGIPSRFALFQNYPNPFNPLTTICYQLPRHSQVTLKIFNILGHQVRTVVHRHQEPGYYAVKWDGKDQNGKDLPTGLYFCKMKASGAHKQFVRVRKLLFVR